MYGESSALYDEWSQCYDPTNIEISTIERYVSFQDKKVLEIGCGTGRFTQKIAHKTKSIMAIDNDQKSIIVASGKSFPKSVVFKAVDALDIRSENVGCDFDVVLFSWSLNYIENKEEAIKKAKQLLNKNGVIVVLYTAYGEYERLMAEVSGIETINDNEYDIVKSTINDLFSYVQEDFIIAPFVFRNIEEATRLNIFFFNDEADRIKEDIQQRWHTGLSRYIDNNGSIVISDTVNLLVGGNVKCSN